MSYLMKENVARFIAYSILRSCKKIKQTRLTTCLRYSSSTRLKTAPSLSCAASEAASISDGLDMNESYITIKNNNEEDPLILHHIWLRDHCRCEKCFNNVTKQRLISPLDYPLDVKPEDCQLKDDVLSIKWHDGHISEFSIDWLQNQRFNKHNNKSKIAPVLWTKDSILNSDVAHVDMKEFMSSEVALSELIMSVLKYGCGFVENVPVSLEATKTVANRITFIQSTFYGDMWETSPNMEFTDTAWTTAFVGAHNDGTYFTDPPGVQLFHCLYHDGDGGESLLLDGFRAANDVKMKYPDSYERLCTIPQGAEYIEKGKHYTHFHTLLRQNPATKELEQIRYNVYDRSIVNTVPTDLIPKFYMDLKRMCEAVEDPNGQWWFKLSPGTVLFFDNWRLLHGRDSFTGFRKIGGCYLGRADFMSRARVLGLL